MSRSVVRPMRPDLLVAGSALSIFAAAFLGCSSEAPESGGPMSAGGTSNATSGPIAGASHAAGGSVASGGSLLTGGTPSIPAGGSATAFGGGSTVRGGTSGNSTGGRTGSGSSSGGATSSGGTASGGANAGGAKAMGGTVSKGGASSFGGSKASGGSSTVGGTKSSGGSSDGGASGGKASGGQSSGGNGARGGTTGAGGSSSGMGGCLDGPAVVVPAGYELVWSDEFNVDGAPDPTNWGYETGFVRNEEAQWYQPDNARVEKGCLVIEGRRERKTNPNYQSGSSSWKTNRQYAEYTSSSLHTSGKRSWQYGRFEMRGRIKTQAGLWPAWWTLGVSGEWPSNGEIDIMEYYAGMIRANVASGTATRWQAKWDGAAWNVATFEDKDWQSKFHVWRMDWNSTKIDLYLDDKLVNTTNLSDMLNPDGTSPFKQPHYMLVNLAIGGINGGDPSGTAFPTRYEVDYVRVFQTQ